MELSLRAWGDGSRRALLLHGLSSSSEVWWRLGPDIAALGYSVVGPDLRGHGDTGPAASYSLPAFVGDVLGTGTGWDVVLGHSLGGLVAVAAQSMDPTFARTLILEDPVLAVAATAEWRGWLRDEYLGDTSPEGLLRANPRWHPTDAATKSRALAAAGPTVVDAVLADLDGTDAWDEVAALTVPTLIVGADPEQDAVVSPHRAAAVVAANPLVEYVMVPGSSHSIHRDSYRRFLDLVHRFVAPPAGGA